MTKPKMMTQETMVGVDPKKDMNPISSNISFPPKTPSSFSRFSPHPLNDIEMKAVRSMIAYVAWKEGNTEEKICEFLLTAFGVTTLQTMPSSRYDDILHFLLAPTLEVDIEGKA